MEISSGSLFDFEKKYNLPVVFLPGIMGSRLRIFVNGDVVPWEPDSEFTSVARHFNAGRSAKTVRNRLDPVHNAEFPEDWESRPSLAQLREAAPPEQKIPDQVHGSYGGKAVDNTYFSTFSLNVLDHLAGKGWNEVSWDYYGDFLVHLQSQNFLGANCPVYAVGYDWRGTNEKSAQRLNDRIEDIKEEEDAEQVVVITHSMGGLVSRSYIEQYGESDIQAIVHITQPTYGAPILYRRFMAGGDPVLDEGMSIVLRYSREETSKVLSVLDGVLELLPTSDYPHSSWLWWGETLEHEEDFDKSIQNVYDIYREKTGKIGIIPPEYENENNINRKEFERKIRSAVDFQKSISEIFHSKTYWICSVGKPTESYIKVSKMDAFDEIKSLSAEVFNKDMYYPFEDSIPNKYFKEIPRSKFRMDKTGIAVSSFHPNNGDGTVPIESQQGYNAKHEYDDPEGVLEVEGVEHAQACENEHIQKYAVECVQKEIADYAKNKSPKISS